MNLKLDGLSLDVIYESFIRQVAGENLQNGKTDSLKTSVEKDKKRKELKKQIAILQGKIRREKQLNRQMELNVKVKRLRKELEGLE